MPRRRKLHAYCSECLLALSPVERRERVVATSVARTRFRCCGCDETRSTLLHAVAGSPRYHYCAGRSCPGERIELLVEDEVNPG